MMLNLARRIELATQPRPSTLRQVLSRDGVCSERRLAHRAGEGLLGASLLAQALCGGGAVDD
jgi:hypothetical protein